MNKKEKKRLSDRLAEKPVFRFILNSKYPAEMIFKCVVLVAFAYGYPFLCGLIFQRWLHIEHLLSVLLFIGITIIIIYIVVIYLIIAAIARYIRDKKRV